ncbi:hypothetical protein [Vagococcus salmoninarum]|uniref:hypothetical protein n=1 Tax=Vagococcus salmoninarum TaxID=2739 RepID=UPI00187E8845|nr:hypothetical protein [Vagococcus salmoninarum]MBE9388213.1 hypothetical protein [Vagococcus salmoninarum]
MIKKKLLILGLLVSVSWGLVSHQKEVVAATSDRSQVGIYFEEISPNPPPESASPPSKLPQTGNVQPFYLQIVGMLVLACAVFIRKGCFMQKKGGNK